MPLNNLSMLDLSWNIFSGPTPLSLSNISFDATDKKSVMGNDCDVATSNESSLSYLETMLE